MKQLSDKTYLAYVRVSSDKQTLGTSLAEQHSYIEKYAESRGLLVSHYYEEVESASAVGRNRFSEMIRDLETGDYKGIIFHKVDRSARNPRDQAVIFELMQKGYEFHFAGENVSTTQNSGRQLIYLLWGMASGYTENLKAEINKGILGRLKQGRVPAAVPVGYIKGEECKAFLDPVKAPLMKQLFTDYASGGYSVEMLVKRAREIGITNIHGRPLSRNSLHMILRQPFYYGLIRHRKGFFAGEHEPLITKTMFDKIQYFLNKKGFKRKYRHVYIFGGLLKCPLCKTTLKSMTAKGRWKYYYCRNAGCSIKALSEKKISEEAKERLKEVELNEEELVAFKQAMQIFNAQTGTEKADQIRVVNLELKNTEARLDGLVNKLVDEAIDDETYKKTREKLLNRQLELQERRSAIERADSQKFIQIEQLGKLLKSPSLAYEMADPLKKRRLVMSMVENLSLTENGLVFHWKKTFEIIANRPKPEFSALDWNRTSI